ncbi:MAG TPA: DUF3108 domain-containing protein [Blastocatellia bacterium]|nr:DUF3108 domain-containing protein [Blastocatellia bacterium]
MKRIISTSLLALMVIVGLGATSPIQAQQSAEQIGSTSSVPLATLRREFKDSLPIPVGEKLVYEVKYARFPLKATVGQVTFEYLGTITSRADENQPGSNFAAPLISGLNVVFNPLPGDQFVHLRATAVSKGILVAILGADVKDRFETLANSHDFSARLHLTEIKEGKKNTVQSIIYDQGQQQIKYLTTDLSKPEAPPKSKFLPHQDGMMSLLSAFYFVRLQKYKEGQYLRFPVSTDEKNYQFDVKVGKREKIKTACGKVQTIKLEPQLFGPGRIFSKKGEMTMWVTDNKKHVPLQLVAKTAAGTITAKLINYNNRKKSCSVDDPDVGEMPNAEQ